MHVLLVDSDGNTPSEPSGPPGIIPQFPNDVRPEVVQATPVLSVTATEIERMLVVDPSSVVRECPISLCPAHMKCPGEGTCCNGGTHCCPVGSSCLQLPSHLPQNESHCVLNTKQDPNDCVYEKCSRANKCPYSGVPVCCLGGGGRACCKLGTICVPGNPPACRPLDEDSQGNQLLEYKQLIYVCFIRFV